MYLCIEMGTFSKIAIIVDRIPSDSESDPNAYIIPELEAYAARYDKVYVIPLVAVSPPLSLLPQKVEIVADWAALLDSARQWLLRYTLRFLNSGKEKSLQKKAECAASEFAAICFGKFLKRWNQSEDTLFYSPQITFATIALARQSTSRYIIRIGREDFGILKRHKEIIDNALLIAADSRYVKEQLDSERIVVRFRGSTKKDERVMAANHTPTDRALTFLSETEHESENQFSLNFRLLRQLALGRPSVSVRWIHFGNDEEHRIADHLHPTELPPNLTIKIFDRSACAKEHLYSSFPIDWYISTLRISSIPVGISRAMSYGVPVIATMTHGIDEAIDDDNGLLLPPDPEPEEFVRGLLPYLDSPARYARLSANALRTWQLRCNPKPII